MRIRKLDGLRGIFSLMIVFIHYPEEMISSFIYNNFIFRESYIFVDYFFVLSGFVISYNYNKLSTLNEFSDYLKKRFIRLYPLLIFTSVTYLAYIICTNELLIKIFPSIFEKTQSTFSSEHFISFFDSILFTNSTNLLGTDNLVNPPSWSISAEMIAYISFGLITISLYKMKKNIALFIIVLISVIICVNNENYFSSSDYGFIRALICFNIGYFVWVLSHRQIELNAKLEYMIPIVILIELYILNSLNEKMVFKQMFGLVSVPIIFGISIFILLKTNGQITKILETKPFQYLGKRSYSIYLNHYIICLVMPKSIYIIFKIPINNISQIVTFMITVSFSILFSHYTYKYIELRGGQYLKSIIFKKNTAHC